MHDFFLFQFHTLPIFVRPFVHFTFQTSWHYFCIFLSFCFYNHFLFCLWIFTFPLTNFCTSLHLSSFSISVFSVPPFPLFLFSYCCIFYLMKSLLILSTLHGRCQFYLRFSCPLSVTFLTFFFFLLLSLTLLFTLHSMGICYVCVFFFYLNCLHYHYLAQCTSGVSVFIFYPLSSFYRFLHLLILLWVPSRMVMPRRSIICLCVSPWIKLILCIPVSRFHFSFLADVRQWLYFYLYLSLICSFICI